MMTFSLIICTRNRIDILIANLRSYFSEFRPDDEILIIDSSIENNAEKIKQSLNYENCFYYHTNPGLPLQRNYGIHRAVKDSIIFLDDDISLEKNTISDVRNYFESNPHVDAVTGALTEKAFPGCLTVFFEKLFGKIFFTSYFGFSNFTRSGLPVIPLHNLPIHRAFFLRGGFSIYKRHVFEDINYDEFFTDYAFLEDTDFSLSFSKCFTAMFCPEFKGTHSHLSLDTTDFENSRHQYVENFAYIYHKHKLGNKLKFCWTLLGLMLLNLAKSVLKRNHTYFTGTLKGMLHLCLQKSADVIIRI